MLRLSRFVSALVLGSALSSIGCAPEIGGRASFPVLSRATLPNYYEPVTTIDEKRCTHVILFLVAWGEDPNHEALVSDLLSQYKGDAIADAELTFFSIPALVYTQSCARVRGTIVRRTAPNASIGPKAGEVPK
jgi:hypothetical protein